MFLIKFFKTSSKNSFRLSIFVAIVFYAFLGHAVIHAKNISYNDIKGYIIDAKSGETLPYANVVLIGENQGAATNSDGYFVIVNAPTGICTLQVSFIGYKKKEVLIDNNPKKSVILKIKVEPKAIELDQVVVTAEAYEVFKSSENVSQLTISPRDLQVLPVFGEIDIFRSLQLLPGISGVGDGKAGH